jgi:hypothetical protein
MEQIIADLLNSDLPNKRSLLAIHINIYLVQLGIRPGYWALVEAPLYRGLLYTHYGDGILITLRDKAPWIASLRQTRRFSCEENTLLAQILGYFKPVCFMTGKTFGLTYGVDFNGYYVMIYPQSIDETVSKETVDRFSERLAQAIQHLGGNLTVKIT